MLADTARGLDPPHSPQPSPLGFLLQPRDLVAEAVAADLKAPVTLLHCVEGRDVGDPRELSTIARQAGLPETVVTAFLEGQAGVEEGRLDAAAARRGGISSVPTFVLDGELLFSGAIPPEDLAVRLRQAAAANTGR